MSWTHNSRNTRGSLLIVVLGFVILLSSILVAFIEEATAEIKYHGLNYHRDDLRNKAFSALEISLAIMNEYGEIDGELWGPRQGWKDPLTEAGLNFENDNIQIDIVFEDFSSKIPLATVDYEYLRNWLTENEVRTSDAENLADALIDWQDEDDNRRLNGFDGDDYEIYNPPYYPPNKPITSWDEFELVEGWKEVLWEENGTPKEILTRFRSTFSLNQSEQLNINSAHPYIFEILERNSDIRPESLLRYLYGDDNTPNTEDDRLFTDLENPALPPDLTGEQSVITGIPMSISSNIWRIVITATRGEGRFLLNALVEWKGGADPSAGVGRNSNQSERDIIRTDTRGNTLENQDPNQDNSSSDALGYPFKILELVENFQKKEVEWDGHELYSSAKGRF